ncbi:MAG: glycoside hydrolase family 65 protein [Bacteroidia bacterium]|nr:MAG: glycoside hydrolase family 65 protein [Bacteroidia bacterium]
MKENWFVEYDKWDPDDHPVQEALCALGNGYFVTRGALEMEKDNARNYPGTYLACGFNRMKSTIKGKEIENEDLVNWPNWLMLNFRIGNKAWFQIKDVKVLGFITSLNMEEGVLERKMRFQDDEDRITTIISRRLVSMDDLHVAGLEWTFIPENWSGKITIRSGIDGNIINNNVARYSDLNQDHLDVTSKGSINDNSVFLASRTKQSDIRMTQAVKTRFFVHQEDLHLSQKTVHLKDAIAGDFSIECRKLEPIRIEKLAAIYTSRDMAVSDPFTEAKTKLERLTTFAELARRQKQAWKRIWSYNDMIVEANSEDQMVVRLHIFHLYQTVSKNSIDYDIGIPARGWHGEGYRGHIFWDELYIQPYIDLHYPQLSRSLLMYRYRRLPEAYEAAREIGKRGALFPWQSGSNGREETQKIHLNPKSGRWLPDVSHLQYHINVAVPYNVWHYYQSTGDTDFLNVYGAEIIFATALFWSDMARFNPKRNRYEIHGVMGPDEYHTHYPGIEKPGLNNNAYTNVMAVWVIQRAMKICNILDETTCDEVAKKLSITAKDKERWNEIIQKMYVPFHNGDIISQFEGYEELDELDWEHYRGKYGDAMRLDRILESENDSPNHYKASKQADVLMLFYLFSYEELHAMFEKLGYTFEPEIIPKNIDYYYERTSHGSTLSQVIHSWVYARSHRDRSWKSFKTALMSDFKDIQGGTTHEGIHLGAMAGTLDILQRCYSGLEIRDDVLWLNPKLPDDIKVLSFHVRYRSHWIKLEINHDEIRVDFCRGWAEPVHIGIRGRKYYFETDDRKTFKTKSS